MQQQNHKDAARAALKRTHRLMTGVLIVVLIMLGIAAYKAFF
jgi:hypothetical protein